ncbi:GGDEF domain-containing protein [Roseateles violae]|uniref:diguanylate cyclase n=1 Tax=Roseateles violae TaxID=3058042 RepID=A0ABT8DNF5_9BURK|nr:GGDEF domain-containing protein [Pelomonas sp. PFR6]MDN3919521.1 GGDEF domain-containing protein [Pelomonas sp. PFR6]
MSKRDDEAMPAGLAETLLALQQHSQQLVALYDPQDMLRYANPAFCQAYKVEPDGRQTWADMMRQSHASGEGACVEADDIEAWLHSVSSHRRKKPFRAFEADLSDGRWLWVTETAQPQGWLLCVASDISSLRRDQGALRQARAEALTAAHSDALTGIGNRQHGMQLLQRALRHGEGWPLCVATLDIDHFKQINDGLGPAAGDAVLCDFARQLQASIRREDGCARVGGEEFLLILPAAAAAQAGAIIERLLARVRRARPLAEQPGRGYSCSVGLAEAVWGEEAGALLRRAEAALHRAKDEGRDRCVLAEA